MKNSNVLMDTKPHHNVSGEWKLVETLIKDAVNVANGGSCHRSPERQTTRMVIENNWLRSKSEEMHSLRWWVKILGLDADKVQTHVITHLEVM